MRLTAFATNTKDATIAALELRHRQRARAEDRIRTARSTGLTNLPLHDTAQNQVWLEIVQIALDLLAWMPMLSLTGPAQLREPKRLRLRLFSAAAQLVTTGRRHILRLAKHWPWTTVISDGLPGLAALPRTPADQQLPALTSSTTPTGAVEPGAHPTRQQGHQPAHKLKSPLPTSRKGPSAS